MILLAPEVFFFFYIRFIDLEGRELQGERKRQGDRCCIHWFTPQMTVVAWVRASVPFCSPMWLAGTQALELFSAVFPCTPAGNLTVAHMWYWLCEWWSNRLCHSADPRSYFNFLQGLWDYQYRQICCCSFISSFPIY